MIKEYNNFKCMRIVYRLEYVFGCHELDISHTFYFKDTQKVN